SLEPPGRKRQSGQTWHVRVRGVERHVQFDATVRVGGGEQVDDAQLLAVIVPGYQRDPESVGEQVGCRGEQVVRGDGGRAAAVSDREANRIIDHDAPTKAAAASSRPASGPGAIPMTAQAPSPATSATAVVAGRGETKPGVPGPS